MRNGKKIARIAIQLTVLASFLIVVNFFINFQQFSDSIKTQRESFAVAKTWDGGGDGESWNDPANWNPDGVPQSGDDVTIDSTTTVYIPSQFANESARHHWTLDDNAANTDVADSKGSATGTAQQNTSSLTTTGKVSSALTFNGTSDLISFGDLNTTSTDQITISAWVIFDDLTGHQAIYTDGGQTRGFEFGLFNDELHIGIENNNSHRSLGYSTTNLSTGTWYHLFVIADGPNGDIFLYVDGSLVASDTALTAFTDFNGSDGTFIGSVGNTSPSGDDDPAGSTANYFDGTIDNVRVFDSILTEGDVDFFYNSGNGQSGTEVLPVSTTVNSLTLGNGSGTTSPELNFSYNALGATNNLDVTGNLTVHSSSTITHLANETEQVFIADIDVGGIATITGDIDVSGKGYQTNQGPGSVSGGNNSASHGGEGGKNGISGDPGPIYGSITAPTTIGSSGGGIGGGYIRLHSDGDMIISGSVNANAASTGILSGGGAGGGIYLTTDSELSGTGSITANAGNGTNSRPGGGGGRIAIEYDTQTDSRTVTAYGGTSGNRLGGAGTIYLLETNTGTDELIIDNNSSAEVDNYNAEMGHTPLTPSGTPLSLTVDDITVQNEGHLVINSDTTLTFDNSFDYATNGNIHDNGGNLLDGSTGGDLNDGPFEAGYDVTIPVGGTWYANTDKTINSLTVNGTLTHSNNTTTGAGQVYDINLTVSNNVSVPSGGSIDVLGKGYAPANGPGNGGQTNNSASHGGEGGSFGIGANPGDVYGSVTAPTTIGSGGGAAGGGAVRINATGDVSIVGSISADGSPPGILRGGGAGGGIYLSAGGELSGTGSITADGSNGTNGRPGGGGGRIAIEYDTQIDSRTVTAYGGTSTTNYRFGGAGTIYFSDTNAGADELIIDNNSLAEINNYNPESGYTPLTPSGTPLSLTVDDITVQNEGQLVINSDTTLTFDNSLDYATNGNIYDRGGSILDGTTGGDLNDGPFEAGYDVTIPVGGTWYADTDKTINSLTVNGTLTHSNNTTTGAGQVYDINLTVTNAVTVASGGSINVNGKGYAHNQGPGTGGQGNYAASHGGQPGQYGVGGTSSNDTYGSITAPATIGSGGGNPGGGYVRLDAGGDVNITGDIVADGFPFTANTGGGSGGGIYLSTDGEISGSGSITANGGNATGNRPGGGGGRIAIEYDSEVDNRTITAYGGTSSLNYRFGGAGTIYLNNTNASTDELIIDNNDSTDSYTLERGTTPLTPAGTPLSLTLTTVTLQNEGHLDLNSDTTVSLTNLNWSGVIEDNGGTMTNVTSGDLVINSDGTFWANTTRSVTTVTNNGTISHAQNTSSETYTVNLTTSGDFTVNSGGSIDVTGMGNTSENGQGPGSDRGTYGSGAGHGGAGGATADSNGGEGATYDSDIAPVNIGSGGGSSNQNGGDGGGAVRLTVGGNMLLNGDVIASAANDAGVNAGGGSGGAIWIDVTGQFNGSGDLIANGGEAYTANAGAGGGGRVRYECASGGWTGVTSVLGGAVGFTAGAGTATNDCTLTSPPTVDTVRIGTTANGTNVAPLTLTTNTTTTYYVNGQVSDDDGFADIQDVDAVLYRSGATGGAACTADNNDCYIQTTCSLTGGSGNSIDYSCQIDLQYYADPTDSGTYAADTWNVRVSVSDNTETVNSDGYTNEVNSLSGINIPGDVDHGTVALGAKQDGTTLTVFNGGNVDVDIDVSMGSALSCTSGSIPIANNKYDLSDVAYDSMANTLSSTPTTIDVNLPAQTNDASQPSDIVYWGIEIPSTLVSGSCSGTLTVTAN